MGFFRAKYILFKLKKVRRSYLSSNWRGIQNLERNRLVLSKLTEVIWEIFTWALKNFINFHFNGLLSSKVYIIQAKKVRRSYLSSNWRGIQNLERNRLVLSKLTEVIWEIFTWALKNFINFHFNGLLLSKVYIVQAKKVQGSFVSWNWRGIQNLERKQLVVSKLT